MPHSIAVRTARTPATKIVDVTLHLPQWASDYVNGRIHKIEAIKQVRVLYGHKDPISGAHVNMHLSSAKNLVESFKLETLTTYEDDYRA